MAIRGRGRARLLVLVVGAGWVVVVVVAVVAAGGVVDGGGLWVSLITPFEAQVVTRPKQGGERYCYRPPNLFVDRPMMMCELGAFLRVVSRCVRVAQRIFYFSSSSGAKLVV